MTQDYLPERGDGLIINGVGNTTATNYMCTAMASRTHLWSRSTVPRGNGFLTRSIVTMSSFLENVSILAFSLLAYTRHYFIWI